MVFNLTYGLLKTGFEEARIEGNVIINGVLFFLSQFQDTGCMNDFILVSTIQMTASHNFLFLFSLYYFVSRVNTYSFMQFMIVLKIVTQLIVQIIHLFFYLVKCDILLH